MGTCDHLVGSEDHIKDFENFGKSANDDDEKAESKATKKSLQPEPTKPSSPPKYKPGPKSKKKALNPWMNENENDRESPDSSSWEKQDSKK